MGAVGRPAHPCTPFTSSAASRWRQGCPAGPERGGRRRGACALALLIAAATAATAAAPLMLAAEAQQPPAEPVPPTPPVILTAPATHASASLDLYGTAAPGSSISVNRTGAEIGRVRADPTSGYWRLGVTLVEGANELSVAAAAGGAVSGASLVTLTLDTTPPPPPAILNPAGEAAPSRMHVMRGTAEPGSLVEVRVNGTLRGSASAHYSATGAWFIQVLLEAGSNNVSARAVDGIGNPSAFSSVIVTAPSGSPPSSTLDKPPVPTAAVHDNDGTFALASPTSVKAFESGGRAYALVAAGGSAAVQVVDFTDPSSPVAAATIRDDARSLGWTRDVELFASGGSRFAAVTSLSPGSVELVDVTDPLAPSFSGSAGIESLDADGASLYPQLLGARDAAVFGATVNGTAGTYLMVVSDYGPTALDPGGFQIINVTHPPAPTPVSDNHAVFRDGQGRHVTARPPTEVPRSSPITSITLQLANPQVIAIFDADGDPVAKTVNHTLPGYGTRNFSVPVEGLSTSQSYSPNPAYSLSFNTVMEIRNSTGHIVSLTRNGEPFPRPETCNPGPYLSICSDQYRLFVMNNNDTPADRGDDWIMEVYRDGLHGYPNGHYGYPVAKLVGGKMLSVGVGGDPLPLRGVGPDGRAFEALEGAGSVDTFASGGGVYAVVAAKDADAVQVINVTDPTRPRAVAEARDGRPDDRGGTFDKLAGAAGVGIAQVGGRAYAVVAASGDDGVQIIDVTDPASPRAVSSVADEPGSSRNRFSMLGGATGVEIFVQNSRTYALVSSWDDDGFQVIDITDPASPREADRGHDGNRCSTAARYSALGGALASDTLAFNGRLYAVLAANFDDGLQVVDVTDPDRLVVRGAVFDELGGFSELTAPISAHAAEIKGREYVFVASYQHYTQVVNGENFGMGGGVQIVDVTDPSSPRAAAALGHSDRSQFALLHGVRGIDTFAKGARTYAIITAELALGHSQSDDKGAFTIVDVTNPERPRFMAGARDGQPDRTGTRFDMLNAPAGVDTAVIGGKTYAVIAARGPYGQQDHGVQIVDVSDPRSPLAVASIRDGDADGAGGTFDTLERAHGVDIVQIGSGWYALVAAIRDNGVQVIEITDPSSPRAAASIVDDGTNTALRGAYEIKAFEKGGKTYAIVSAKNDDGVQVLNITDPSAPDPIDKAEDSLAFGNDRAFSELKGAHGVDLFTHGGNTYAAVASVGEDHHLDNCGGGKCPGVQIINMSNPARILAHAVTWDTREVGGVEFHMRGARGIATFTAGESVYAAVTGYTGDQVQIMRLVAATDGRDPAAVGASLNKERGLLYIEFDELVKTSSNVDLSLVSIRDGSGSVSAAVPLGGASLADASDGKTVVIALTDAQRAAVAAIASPVLEFTSAGAFEDLAGNDLPARSSVAAALVTSSPELLGARIDLGTGEIAIAFTEAVNSSEVDLSRIAVYSSDAPRPRYSPSAVATEGGNTELSVRLGLHERQAVINLTGTPLLDVLAGAANSSETGRPSAEYRGSPFRPLTEDRVDPRLLSASLGLDGVLSLEFDEYVNVRPSRFDLDQMYLRDGDGDGAEISLDGAPLLTTANGTSVLVQLTGAQIEAVAAYSRVVLDMRLSGPYSAVEDLSGQGIGDVRGLAVSVAGTPGMPVGAPGPSVIGTSSPNATGIYGIGDVVHVRVRFSGDVLVDEAQGSPLPSLVLETGRTDRSAAYISGSGTAELAFSYAVRDGDRADDLDYYNATALSGGITDRAGNAANLTLNSTGSPGSLAGSGDIVVDTAIRAPVAANSTVSSPGSFALGGAWDVDALVLGGRTHLLATSFNAHEVHLIRVHDNGTLSQAGKADRSTDGLGSLISPGRIDAFFIGGDAYALVVLPLGSAVHLIRIHEDGTIRANGSLAHGAAGVDFRQPDTVAAFGMGNGTYALVTAFSGDAVNLIRVHANGTLRPVGMLADGGGLELDGAAGVAVLDMGGNTYALVTSYTDDAVHLIRVHENGTLRHIASLKEGGALELDAPRSVAAFELDGSTYAIAASQRDDGVQLIRVREDSLEAAGSAANGGGGGGAAGFALNSPYDVDAFTLGGNAYAIVSTSAAPGGVQLIRVRAADGALFAAGSAAHGDPGFDSLAGANGLNAFAAGGGAYAAVASPFGSAVQLVRMSPASVARVDSAAADGAYSPGHRIDIDVRFDDAVRIVGPPSLQLNSGGTAPYQSGNGSDKLTFRYTVAPGEDVADLDYVGIRSLSGGGAITDEATGTAANRTLPPPGAGRSLGDLKDIEIDTVAPRMLGVAFAVPDGVYTEGRRINVTATFDEPVVYTSGAAPSLALNVGGEPRAAAYASGSGTTKLNFSYTVRDGDRADDLDYYSTSALSGGITDRAGNAADLTLNSTGSPGSLAGSGDIVVDTAIRAPVAANSTASSPGSFALGGARDVDALVLGGRTHVLATSFNAHAVHLIRVHENGTLSQAGKADRSTPGFESLSNPSRIDAFFIGGDAYALVVSSTSSAVRMIRVHENGTISANGSLTHGAAGVDFRGADTVAAFGMGNGTYALVTASTGDAVNLIRVHENGTLRPVGMLADGGGLELDGAAGVAVLDMGGNTYALVTSYTDDAVHLIRVHDNGTLRHVDSLKDGGALELDEPRSVAAFTAGGLAYAIAASQEDNGVQLIRVREDSLEAAGSAANGGGGGGAAGFALDGPYDVDAFTLGGSAYAIVSTNGSAGGVQLIRVRAADGALFAAGSAAHGDPGFDSLAGANGLNAFAAGSGAYAAVASFSSSAVQLVRMSPASVARVDSAAADGAYSPGHRIDIDVRFDDAVRIAGPPSLQLNSGGTAPYQSGNGSDKLTFRYTVAPGEDVADLDYVGIRSLSGGGAITDEATGTAANRTLPPPGAGRSLGDLKNIEIDTVAPRMLGVAFAVPNGAYTEGRRINVTATFDEPVVYTSGAAPSLALNVGGEPRAAAYASGNGTTRLNFSYTVRDGDRADDLDYYSTTALSGSITDRAGNAADLTLQPPGSPGSLAAAAGAVSIDAAAPRMLGVAFAVPDGAYTEGRRINVTATFDEPVVYTSGEAPSLALNVGGEPRAAAYASGNGTTRLNFSYTVRDGDRADDLDYYSTTALSGSITDRAGNAADLTLQPPGSPGSLSAAAGAVSIDAVVPRMLGVAFAVPNGMYTEGRRINVTATFDEPVVYTSGAAPSLALNVGGEPRAAAYASGNGTTKLNFSYTVRDGDRADDLDYYNATALSGSITDRAGNAADLALPPPGSPGSLSAAAGAVSIDAVVPRMLGVAFAVPDGAYTEGRRINVTATFDEPVVYTSGAAPSLALNVGGEPRAAAYASGSGTTKLNFSYTVRDGDRADDLDYYNATALSGSITDRAGNAADLALPPPGSPGSLSAAAGAVSIDAVVPRMLGVAFAVPDGAYTEGRRINVTATFDEPVVYTSGAAPSLALNVGGEPRAAAYASGSGTTKLNFSYTVRDGDRADDLDYYNATALSGSITDRAGNAADLALPPPGSPGSLSATASIEIDAVQPGVVSVTSPNRNGTYRANDLVNITVTFGEPVFVTGRPLLLLSVDVSAAAADSSRGTPRAIYGSGNETTALVFLYDVRPGDSAGDLEYAGRSALVLDGGSIKDMAGNAANLTLPPPGSPGSLGGSSDIEINATGRASVVRVSSPDMDGAYGAGSRINITVTFSGPVAVTGSPRLALDTGSAAAERHAGYVAPAGAGAPAANRTLAFLYVAQPGDNTGRLGYAGSSALDTGGGSITDAETGLGAGIRLPTPGSERSLAGSKAIALDTAAPRVDSVSSPNQSGAYGAGDTIEIRVKFTEPVGVTGEPVLALDIDVAAGAGGRHALYAPGAAAYSPEMPFLYEVRPGDSADDLEYAGRSALVLDGGSIKDMAGNAANLTLPPPGSGGSLGDTSNMSVRGGAAAGMANGTTAATADAVFAGPNTIRIEYSAPLGARAGHAGPVYGAIALAGGGGGMAVPLGGGVSGLGTAVHTVRFGGGGVAPDQNGTIALNTDLHGTAPNGTMYSFTDDAIDVRAGAEAQTLMPAGPAPVVAIERDGFVRGVDAAAGGDSARPAINVTGLAEGDPAPGAEGITVTFPGGAGTAVIAPFAEVSFPPNVTAVSVPRDGLLELYVSGGRQLPEKVAAALGVDASHVEVRRVVEVGDNATHIAFDMPVRILLDGQAGGRAFYVNNTSGEVERIRTACVADDTGEVHAQLGGAGEGGCWFELGGDMVIYTYHLTRFGTAAAPTPLELMVAGTAAGGTVRVPAGTYAEDVLAVNKSLTIEPADPESPPVLTGYSHVVVAAPPQGSNNSGGGGPVTIRGLVFRDTARAPGGAGALASITVEPAPGAALRTAPVTIESNTFRNTCDTAVRAAAAAAAGAPPIAELTVRNNRFYDIGGNSANCGAGGAPPGVAGRADAIAAGRYDGGGSPARLAGMAVQDNYIFGTTHTGIRMAGADGLLVRGNHIEDVPDDGMRIVESRNVQVHLNTIVGANSAPRVTGHDGAAGAAIEVWSGSDDVAATLNRVSGSAGAFLVCAGTCDPGPGAANGTAGGPVRVAAAPVNAANGSADMRFNHNVLAESNTGMLVANGAGGVLDARANYWPGHADSAAGRVSPAGAVLHEPALGDAGPVRIGAVVADGPSSAIRSVDAAVRAAFELGVREFNAGQARDGGAVGLEPAVYTVGSPDYAADARAAHASAVSALLDGSSSDARMLPVLHNSISSAMSMYDASGAAALAAISAMGAEYAHYPFVLNRSGAIVAHGADASLAGGYGGDGAGAAVAAGLFDFAPEAAAAAGTGVEPGHPDAPWKWRAHESADPATDAAGPKRSVLALHPGRDGLLHNGDDLVFGAGYHPGPGAAHLVVAAGDAAAAAAGSGAIVAVSPASTASQLAARDALFRLAPPDALLAGVVMAQALADRSDAAAPITIVALNDSASLQSMSLAGELYEIDLQGALPDGVDRIGVVSYNSSSPPPAADGGGGAAAGWAAAAAGRIREAASAPQQGEVAFVYSGRAGAFAALADALAAAAQPLPGARWYSTGDLARAELASSGPNAAALARAGQLAAVLQYAAPNAEIDAYLAAPGAGIVLDESTRGPAYAAYDAPALLGRAMASTPGVPGAPAAVARAIDEDVARTHAGALGSPLILDRNGDLVLPIAYAVSAFPAAVAGADPGGAWAQLDNRVGERSCGIALAKGALDFGILSLGRYSRPDTQTVINTGTLPYRSVTLDPGDWTYASGQTLPASITELRELGRAAAYAGAASGFVVAPDLAPGQDRNVQFRINLTAYQSLPPGEASQTINYLVECRAAAR